MNTKSEIFNIHRDDYVPFFYIYVYMYKCVSDLFYRDKSLCIYYRDRSCDSLELKDFFSCRIVVSFQSF